MENKAKLVIIGAGIVGCSTAYHLAKLGWRDIVVIDRGPLFATGGSTSHAPGLVFQTNYSKTMTLLAKYTVELYSQLETSAGSAFYGVGSLEYSVPDTKVDIKYFGDFYSATVVDPNQSKSKKEQPLAISY